MESGEGNSEHSLGARFLCLYYIMCPTHRVAIASCILHSVLKDGWHYDFTDKKTKLQQQSTPGSSLVSITEFEEMIFAYHDLVLDG